MSKSMPKSISDERFRWIKPILDNEITIKKLAEVSPFCVRTIKNWLSLYRKFGLDWLQPKSTRPKSHPNETPIHIKEKVLEFRQKSNKCALKLENDLQLAGMNVKCRTIGKIIKNEGLTRRYRTRKLKCKYLKVPLQPGELVEIDIKYVPSEIEGKQYYQFTAIDCASRWRYLEIFDDMSSYSAVTFVKKLLRVTSFRIRAIKTDNGSCFTNRYTGYSKSTDPLNPKLHALDLFCQKKNIIHYLIDPGKPAQNGKVERSHRSDQETFYDNVKCATLEELRYKIKLWNMYYNDLQHCGLNLLSPNQALGSRVQYVRA
jgi:transposase InsO family protein